eukprot:Filipodium_phascolosomae@DN744_c0_g1_i1.p1
MTPVATDERYPSVPSKRGATKDAVECCQVPRVKVYAERKRLNHWYSWHNARWEAEQAKSELHKMREKAHRLQGLYETAMKKLEEVDGKESDDFTDNENSAEGFEASPTITDRTTEDRLQEDRTFVSSPLA